MENIRKRFVDDVVEAERMWKSADHLLTVTFPVVKDSKLLVRAFENIHECLILSISIILRFEYLYKRITLTKDTKKNLEIFMTKCASRYGVDEIGKKVATEIMFFGKKHKESGFEFSKKAKIVIVDDSLKTEELTLERLKQFALFEKMLLQNLKNSLS